MPLSSRLFAVLVTLAAGACARVATRAASTPDASRRAEQTFDDCAGANWCPRMMVIPAGSFVMGAGPGDSVLAMFPEGPPHEVTVRRVAFGVYDVTRAQWAAFVDATNRPVTLGCAWTARARGGRVDSTGSWRDLGFAQDDAHPVVCITWYDALDYVRWLSSRTGQRYRLPSEAEWEFAARAGTTTPYPWGTAMSREHANFGADSGFGGGVARGRDRWVQTSPVGAFPPNAFGLYDMHGNVLQWMQDCFAPSYAALPTDGSAYEADVVLQISGPLAHLTGQRACSLRAVRGGDWGDPPALLRSAARNFGPGPGATLRDYRSAGVGLRVVREID